MPRSLVITKDNKMLITPTGESVNGFRPSIVENSAFIDNRIQGNEYNKGDLVKLAVMEDNDNVSNDALQLFIDGVVKELKGDIAGQRKVFNEDMGALASKGKLTATVAAGAEEYLTSKGKTLAKKATTVDADEAAAKEAEAEAAKKAQIAADKKAADDKAAADKEAAKHGNKQ